MAINISTFGLIVFLLTVVLSVTLPILIGIYVYKDARRRGMNAVLWALISAFAPGFVGLIIYLLVRSDSTGARCNSCNNLVRESFAVCPHCGASLKEHCHTCNSVLESGWANCPQCGTEIPADQRGRLNVAPKKDKGLKWLLTVLIVVPLLLFSILVGSTHIRIKQLVGLNYNFHSFPTKAEAVAEYPFLADWMAECDAKGEGIYHYRFEENSSDNDVQRHIIYNNAGNMLENIENVKGGLFKTKDEIHLHFDYDKFDPNIPIWDYSGPEAVQHFVDYTVKYFEIHQDDSVKFRAFDWLGNEVEIIK